MLRNAKPKDWDVTTNAKPEQIEGLFDHTFYENTYGTVSVVNEDTDDETLKVIEVTPYRLESEYTDNRRPDTVEFSDSLEDDLQRRDFTINAIAYDPQKDTFVDPYQGQKDIKDKTLRTVGDPKDRFNEDALRIMRAVRIHAELGFSIEETTKKGIMDFKGALKDIARERIRDEFTRIIASPNPAEALAVSRETGILDIIIPELTESYGVDQNQAHSFDVWTHLIKSVQHAADKEYSLTVRFAALFHDIGKPATKRWDNKKSDCSFHGHEVVGAKITRKILQRLCFSKEFISRVTTMVRWHMFFSDPEQITLSAVRRLISNIGKENIQEIVNLRICDRIGTGRPKERPYRLRKYQSMIEEAMRDPVSVKSLAVDGNVLLSDLNMAPGPKIGYILHALLEEVLDDPTRNTKEHLLERAKDLLELTEEDLKKLGEKGKEKVEEEDEKALEEIRKKYWVK